MTSKRKLTPGQAAARKKQRAASKAKEKSQRHGLAVLKAKGLYSGDPKRAKINSYQRGLLNTFSDIVAGRGTSVKLPKADIAELKAQGVRIKHGRAAITGAPKEQVRYNKKSKSFIGKRQAYGGVTYREVFFQKTLNMNKLPKPPKGVEYSFRTSFTSPKTGVVTPTAWWPSAQDLEAFLNRYDAAKSKSSRVRREFRELWTGAIEIREVIKRDDLSEEEQEMLDWDED